MAKFNIEELKEWLNFKVLNLVDFAERNIPEAGRYAAFREVVQKIKEMEQLTFGDLKVGEIFWADGFFKKGTDSAGVASQGFAFSHDSSEWLDFRRFEDSCPVKRAELKCEIIDD